MRYLSILGVLLLVLIFGLLSTHGSAAAPAATPVPASGVDAAGNTAPQLPNSLTNFTISNPYCYQPDPSLNKCNINFRYIQAVDNQSSAPFMDWLSITISGKTRFNATAFFEGVITYTYDMLPNGIQVACGTPGAGGAGMAFGNVYSVVVTPLDSSRNAMSTDTAVVTCPAYAP